MILTLQIAIGVFAGLVIIPIVATLAVNILGGIFSILFGD